MNKEEIIKKITEKKEFSKIPKKDVETALSNFNNMDYIDEEKIKLTRDLLRKVFSVFISQKLLNISDKDKEWYLKKHFSTRERFDYYEEVYFKILNDFHNEPLTIFDLGAGVNGFSYSYLKKIVPNMKYFGIEAIGQLVDLMDYYFKKNNFQAKAIQESLFEIENIKKIVKKEKGKKIVFLFKTLDSLEMLKKDYSKKILLELVPIVDEVVISFATKSLNSKKPFYANRKWLLDFIKENFLIKKDFILGNERYVIFF